MYACMHECMYRAYLCMCMYLCMHECMCQNKKIKSKIFSSHKTVTLMNINNISKTAICKNKASTKIGFLTPSPCPHASTWAGPLPLWTSTRGRHGKMKFLVKYDLPDPKLKIDYM